MVEPTGAPKTQLPNPNNTEESKEQTTFMYGDRDAFAQDVIRRLDGVDLNILEQGLLSRYIQDEATCAANVVSLLRKLEAKNLDDPYQLKRIRKVIPLFDVHNFWNTQPVPKYYEPVADTDYNKAIEVKTVADVRQTGYDLPEGYSWCTVDLSDDAQALDVYNLLTKHYVEDTDGKFRFDYSIDFLRWALNPPDNIADWIVGVRGNGQLTAFITAIPVTMMVNGQRIQMAEVNFLCVHKQLRDKRLAPLLISEITRRVNLCNQWQAIYTSGTVLPTPFATAPYWHRNLNPQKLVKVNFSFKPANITQSKYNKLHRLPELPATEGLVPMTEESVAKVTVALNGHLAANYKVHITFTENEVRHFFLPRANVVYSYVVYNSQAEVSDFISFYALNSSVLNDPEYDKIYAAYAYYNFVQDNEQERMKQLMRDALILAKQNNFDVFNMTEVLKHSLVANELLFKPGDGRLAHYLFNWRIKSLQSSDIGIVLV